MYVDWEYYKIFYYVAKYQNFTKAARVLGNNQPNITHSMNRLESQLNCVLFIRSNRGVTLRGEMLCQQLCLCGLAASVQPFQHNQFALAHTAAPSLMPFAASTSAAVLANKSLLMRLS